jgi:hypothetical protein
VFPGPWASAQERKRVLSVCGSSIHVDTVGCLDLRSAPLNVSDLNSEGFHTAVRALAVRAPAIRAPAVRAPALRAPKMETQGTTSRSSLGMETPDSAEAQRGRGKVLG